MAEELAVGAAIGSFLTMMSGINPVSKGVGKLIGMASEQIGYRIQSTNNVIRAKADAEIRLIEVRTEIIVDTLQAAALNEAKIASIYAVDGIAVARENVSLNRRQRHFEQIVLKAAIELSSTPDSAVNDTKVDDDWTNQFFSYAQDIGNEELQFLWAKLLASELKRPGMISRRTLDVVKTLTRDNCETFTTLCTYVWHCESIRETLVILNTDWIGQLGSPVGIQLTDLLLLMDGGLVENLSTYDDYGIKHSANSFNYFGSHYLFRSEHEPRRNMRQNAGKFQLTAPGKEISKVVAGKPDPIYLNHIVEYYQSRGWLVALEQS